MAEYAMDKVGGGSVRSSRRAGRTCSTSDRDASPELLEEKFHAEDQAELASVA